MSDRVAVIGGSTAGRDHLPVTNRAYDYSGAVGDGELYNVAPALLHTCKWFYVVRVWTLSFFLSLHQRKPPPHDAEFAVRNYTVSFDFELFVDTNTDPEADPNYVLPTRESDLLYPRGGEDFADDVLAFGSGGVFGGTNKINITNFSFTDTGVGTFSDDIQFTLGFWYPFPVWNTGSIWELLVFTCSTRGRQFTTFYNESGSTATQSFNYITVNSAYSVPIKCEPDGSSDIHFDSISATLNPKTYWPYKLRDGSPVWDASTGDQLEDPLADYDTDDIEETVTQVVDSLPSTLVVQRNPAPWEIVF